MQRMWKSRQQSDRHTITSSEAGFSMLELMVVLMVIGLLIAVSASIIRPYLDGYRYRATQVKMEHIATALAEYAQKNYAIPCPAVIERATGPNQEPFGAPVGSGSAGDGHNGCVLSGSTITRGIVPFRALGLSEDHVKDAYGEFISYVTTLAPALQITAGNERNKNVHKYCRTPTWIDPALGQNRNFKKAYFCCPAVDGLVVQDETHGSNANRSKLFRRDNRRDGAATGLRDVDQVDTAAPLDRDIVHVPEMIAFALISHGKNGSGALGFYSGGRKADAPSTGTDEVINRQNSGTQIIQRPLQTSFGNNYFDDIVLFRTNFQLMSAFRTNSCMRP